MTKPVAFVVGSDSDLPTLEGSFAVLEELEIGFVVRILSAHRTPREATEFAYWCISAGSLPGRSTPGSSTMEEAHLRSSSS